MLISDKQTQKRLSILIYMTAGIKKENPDNQLFIFRNNINYA